MILTYLIF